MAHALSTAQMELATRTTPYLEPVGAKRRRYRVRKEALRPGLDPHVYAMTSFDLDEQHSTHDDIFVAGVREVSKRARQKRR
jgi:hypothetical protein